MIDKYCCPRCKQFWIGPGQCPCKPYTVWLKLVEKSACQIFASYPEQAAELFCEQRDEKAHPIATYPIITERGQVTIMVQAEGEDPKPYHVRAWLTVEYVANEI